MIFVLQQKYLSTVTNAQQEDSQNCALNDYQSNCNHNRDECQQFVTCLQRSKLLRFNVSHFVGMH